MRLSAATVPSDEIEVTWLFGAIWSHNVSTSYLYIAYVYTNSNHLWNNVNSINVHKVCIQAQQMQATYQYKESATILDTYIYTY